MAQQKPQVVITPEIRQSVDLMAEAMGTQTKDQIVLAAIKYLIMKDARYTMQEIADEWKCDRKTVYNRLAAMRRDGQMEEAEKIYSVPKIEEINAALSDFMNSTPAMIERVKRIILTSGSDKTALEAFAWSWANIIKPQTDAQQKAGAPETAYANRPSDLNPTRIVVPDFLRKVQ